MAFRWRTDDGPSCNGTLGTFVALRFSMGSGPVLPKNYIFVIFRGGGGV